MNIGVIFPQTEFGNDPIAMRDYVQTAEALGFTHVLAYDHVLGANPERPGGWQGPYTHNHPFHEVFVMFSYMAAVTTAIEFITGILILPQRDTSLVAKQAASLDVLSNGRFRLGIGSGWNKVEYVSQGQNFHTRGKRIEEQVELLRRLWTEPLITYEGQWHTIPDAGLNPLPIQQPIPIWFGGHADAVLNRIARMGDGWIPGYTTAEKARPALDKLALFCEANGRSLSDVGIEIMIQSKGNTPESWQKIIAGWQAAGATHGAFNTMGVGLDTPAKHINAIRHFAETILG
ncbi:MAG: LLM class F420-dependent oxidoreductase [Chloroflexi bacterium]|nr:LLM class F420-dependent oxidoreductase [Chloroflexota bacterium]